ncbi:MAG: hypothetical protein JW944_00250 [Deltaproteobacteria bacterium]|nr:hypothetical protein [Deltaproteobacteria bacterium]
MTATKFFSMGFIALLFLAACATAKVDTSEKYNFDNQLESVSEITKFNMMGWEHVDRMSFILQTTPSDYYLFVLNHPSDELPFAENIHISSTGSFVKPGYNNVTVYGPSSTEKYVINKIYKFKNYEQAKEIRKQITGEK